MDPTFYGVLAYIVVSLMIGVWISRRIHTESDYLIAGRSLGYTLGTFSIFATWFGAETCVGAAGVAYKHGVQGVRADPVGYTLCLVLMGLVYAVPLWNRGLTTMADLFRQRFSRGVERLAAAIFFPSSLLWAAAQILAFGHILAASSSLELNTCITFAAAIVIAYTVSGGLLADAYTDLIQGIALILGLLILLVALLVQGVPLAHPGGAVPRMPEAYRAGWAAVRWLYTLDQWAVPIFGSVVAQELISRVIAARSARVARRATLLAAGGYLVVGTIPLYVGLAGAHWFPGLDEPEQAMAMVAQQALPALLYVLYAGALVSAILSTVDSALLAASSLVSHNLIASLRPGMSDRARLWLARGGVIVLGTVAYVLAMHGERTYEMVEDASAMGSAGIFVILSFGLFTRLGGPASAATALLVGAAVWFIGTYRVEFPGVFLVSTVLAALVYLLVAAMETTRAGSPQRCADAAGGNNP